MKAAFSKHVLEELEERKIPRSLVEQVMEAPEQKVPEAENITCYQSRITMQSKSYLLRVMVNENTTPPTVVTAYRTSKVTKYWRQA